MSEYRFHSEHWWNPIKKFAGQFRSWVNDHSPNRSVSLECRDLEYVKKAYVKNLTTFRRWFYGKLDSNNDDEQRPNLDRHKICALYIKSFLEISPFYIKNYRNRDVSEKTLMYPNEYFCLELMKLILMAWNKTNCEININDIERTWFIGLLNHFRLEPDTLDILSLSQIIYYIEKQYINPAKNDSPEL